MTERKHKVASRGRASDSPARYTSPISPLADLRADFVAAESWVGGDCHFGSIACVLWCGMMRSESGFLLRLPYEIDAEPHIKGQVERAWL